MIDFNELALVSIKKKLDFYKTPAGRLEILKRQIDVERNKEFEKKFVKKKRKVNAKKACARCGRFKLEKNLRIVKEFDEKVCNKCYEKLGYVTPIKMIGLQCENLLKDLHEKKNGGV